MQISLTGEDVIAEYRRIVGDLQHELTMQNLLNRKLQEAINKYEQAETERNAVEFAERPMRRLSAAVETLPVPAEPQTPDQPA